MIRCPRCGFEQPRDRFCAKCGIDMESFVPKTSLKSNAYINKTRILIGVVVIFFLAGCWYLFHRDQGPENEAGTAVPRPKPAIPRAQKSLNIMTENQNPPSEDNQQPQEVATPEESPAGEVKSEEPTSINVD